MGSSHVAFFAISMILVSSIAMATDHVVGDDKGWTVDFNYTQWTQDKVFHVGDNLVFNYDNAKHNVFKVSGASFKDCTLPPANEALSTGKDIIPLTTEGRKWYLCGKADHCIARQMKFVINVEAQAAPAPSSAAYSVLSSVFGVTVIIMSLITTIFA
ncbi:blue copper protein 1a-like [Lotus japonicus]|uniref:blue copper protein 1a-like n=1 Tax=Lotus japonicus TaxID=34305 RepID=UPI00258678A7|nr:blue copper protein 1a-like [Lotus japonicus]